MRQLTKRPQRRCPEDFQITDRLREWAEKKGITDWVNIEEETEDFMDYEFRSGRKDWDATWRRWMREARRRAMRYRPRTQPGVTPLMANARDIEICAKEHGVEARPGESYDDLRRRVLSVIKGVI